MISITKLQKTYKLELAADSWWNTLSEHEKDVYLKAHPKSAMGSDHPYNKILQKHGFKHTDHSMNAYMNNPKNGTYSNHVYRHPNPENKSHVIISVDHATGKSNWSHRGQQRNGIMAPTHGETKPSLDKTLTRWSDYDSKK